MVLNEIYSKIHEYKNDNLPVLLERIMGIGDWGLGIGDWGPIPNPQSPIPNPQSPIPINYSEHK